MQRYILFAARSGEVLRDDNVFDDEDAARAWAAYRIAEEFGLSDRARNNFDEAISDCDGAILDLASDDAVIEILKPWLINQSTMLNVFRDRLNGQLEQEIRNCYGATLKLLSATDVI